MSTPTPKFHEVAGDIFDKYTENGFILDMYHSQKKKMIQEYVDQHPSIHPGDILHVGSTYQTRQNVNGYVIISNDKKAIGYFDNAVSLPISFRSEIPIHVSYENMLEGEFNKMMDASYDSEEYFSGLDFFAIPEGSAEKTMYDDILSDYNKHGIL